jgi:hypothetical protein
MSATYPSQGDKNCGEEVEYEKEERESFSKYILKQKIKEFHTGKFTKQYIRVYLDFVHLNGVIDNLEYLEYKEELDKE